MRFACQSCGKHYNLPDEKIAGRDNVKLRCRACGALVDVKRGGAVVAQVLPLGGGRMSEAPAPLPSQVPPPPSQAPAPSQASWAGQGPFPSSGPAASPLQAPAERAPWPPVEAPPAAAGSAEEDYREAQPTLSLSRTPDGGLGEMRVAGGEGLLAALSSGADRDALAPRSSPAHAAPAVLPTSSPATQARAATRAAATFAAAIQEAATPAAAIQDAAIQGAPSPSRPPGAYPVPLPKNPGALEPKPRVSDLNPAAGEAVFGGRPASKAAPVTATPTVSSASLTERAERPAAAQPAVPPGAGSASAAGQLAPAAAPGAGPATGAEQPPAAVADWGWRAEGPAPTAPRAAAAEPGLPSRTSAWPELPPPDERSLFARAFHYIAAAFFTGALFTFVLMVLYY